MAPKTQPTALKKLKGNPGKRPLNEKEPQPELLSSVPSPPKTLGAAGKEEWNLVTAELVRLGLLSCLDVSALKIYCDAYDQYSEADKEVKAYFKKAKSYLILYINKGGGENYIPHPALKLKRDAAEMMLKIGSEFGFTPSSRTKLKTPESSNEKDPFLQYLNQGGRKGEYLDA